MTLKPAEGMLPTKFNLIFLRDYVRIVHTEVTRHR